MLWPTRVDCLFIKNQFQSRSILLDMPKQMAVWAKPGAGFRLFWQVGLLFLFGMRFLTHRLVVSGKGGINLCVLFVRSTSTFLLSGIAASFF